LQISDLPLSAPIQPPTSSAKATEDEETPAPVQEKTLFNLRLQSYEPPSKPKVIKEVKSLLGLSLVDSKKFVESTPKMMKEGVSKEEGEKIVETLKSLGAVVVME
jgi:large subunit ribosomal protein L7/L12